MRTRRVMGIVCLLVLVVAHTYAYVERNLLQQAADFQMVKAALVMDQKWVPYPQYADRAGWDRFLGTYKDEYIRRGEKMVDYKWQVVKATDYLEFERSGNRRIMEDPAGQNNNALSALVVAELAEGKGRFIDPIINGILYTCEMTTWALSAHIAREQSSHRVFPDARDQVMDLTSGGMAQMLAWTWYFLHQELDKVDPVIAIRLRDELQKRELDPYMQVDTYWWMAFGYKPGVMVNNWNPWCNSNALLCFLLLENDRDKLAAAVYRSMVSVDQFLNYVQEDGACEEGPSYWGHASGKMYDYLQLLSYGTGGKVSLFDQPQIKNMGEYIVRSYVGNDWVVNFADASARGGGDAGLIYRYGKAVGSDPMMAYAAYQNGRNKRKAPISMGVDLFRGFETLRCLPELEQVQGTFENPPYTWYPQTEFCYMTRPNGFFVAAKGGYNNESHNHNDAGTFSLYLNQMPILIDAGVGTYTRQTFSSERYSIWTMQSNYHNLPMINGVPQQFGSQYKATDVKFNPGKMSFSADIATAYPKEAHVKKWIRSYTLNKNSLKIEDRFVLDRTTTANQINFLTWGKVDTSIPGQVIIEVNDQKVRLSYDRNLFTPVVETVNLDDPRLSNVWGKQIYRLSLDACNLSASGTYIYTITPIK